MEEVFNGLNVIYTFHIFFQFYWRSGDFPSTQQNRPRCVQDLVISLIINIIANKMTFFVWHGCGTVAAQFLANRATHKPLIFSPINK